MGKKERKEEKRREKAMARMLENHSNNHNGGGFGYQDDEQLEDDSGICPCAARLTPDMLCANLSQQGCVHITCEKCDEQSNSTKNSKQKGGKKAKHNKRNQRDSSLPTSSCLTGGATYFCLTCGFCGCESHCREHFNDVKYRNKKGHSVYMNNNLFTGYGGSHKGKCFDCDVPLSERFNDADAIAEDTIKGYPVDFCGYVIDDEANEGFAQCCQHIIEVASSGDTSHLPAPQWRKGKKGKHISVSNKSAKKQRKQRARGNANYDRCGVSKGAKEAGLKGLQNLGNTCFFNSVIQSVSNTPGMVEAIMKASSEGKIGSFTTATYALILKLHSSTESVTAQLRMLLSELHRTGPQFAGYGQHDAHELTRFMSERVELEYISNSKKSETGSDPTINPFYNTFHGILLSDVRCTTCGQTSNIEEPFYDISLALTRTIDSSLDLFFTDELLEGYKHPCKHCNEVEFAAAKARQEREKAQMIETIKQQAAERASVSLNELLEVYESDDNSDEGTSEESVEESEDESPTLTPSLSPQAGDTNDLPPAPAGEGSQSSTDPPAQKVESNEKPTTEQQTELEETTERELDESEGKEKSQEETNQQPQEQQQEQPQGEPKLQPQEQQQQEQGSIEAVAVNETIETTKEASKSISENPEKVESSPRSESPDDSKQKATEDDKQAEPKPKVKKITTDASKQYSIKKFPQTLVVHLKRFGFCRSSCAFVKDNKKVEIPSTLDLTPWMADDFEGSPNYEISSTIEHQGEVGYGHYISHTLTQNKWFECNDSWVKESSFSAATRCPYLIFYSRVKQ
eukprot:TRINITY_DN20844_c0_g1_i1.p1 TRINITY_DN20844_c0_g1~~TRINITY_DN20844_c0_g1_i1.p1  ORF type:complete len:812 (+),score=204.78 TRINITY_DN20844_c0_g1_i1:39-2438(+)